MEGAFDRSAATLSSLPPQVKMLKLKRMRTRDTLVLGCVVTAGCQLLGEVRHSVGDTPRMPGSSQKQ